MTETRHYRNKLITRTLITLAGLILAGLALIRLSGGSRIGLIWLNNAWTSADHSQQLQIMGFVVTSSLTLIGPRELNV